MKSQFLINMRAYGEESESVLEEQDHHDSKLEEMEVEMGGSGTQSSAVISFRKEKEDEDSLSVKRVSWDLGVIFSSRQLRMTLLFFFALYTLFYIIHFKAYG